MIITVQPYLQRLKISLRRWSLDPILHRRGKALATLVAGLILSAASLSHRLQPFALALVCSLPTPGTAFAALGGALGYLLFWGRSGMEGVVWCALGALWALTAGRIAWTNHAKWLMSALSGLSVALTGLWLQQQGVETTPAMYILRIGLAMGATRLFAIALSGRHALADWLVCAIGVLSLCQIAPLPWLCLGYPAAAAMAVGSALPAAALAGLALDLAGVTSLPMTGVLSLVWLIRLLPGQKGWHKTLIPAVVYPVICMVTGIFDLTPLPGLIAGGLLGLLLPGRAAPMPRRGEVGVAQVRLELTAEVFRQMQQLMLEQQSVPIDEQALLLRACERACGTCSYRKSCTAKTQAELLDPHILSLPLLDSTLGFGCRRMGRLVSELRRSQEHLRLLRSLHRQQEESRTALTQQYGFLSSYLQSLSDDLGNRSSLFHQRFEPEISFASNRRPGDGGDRCLRFAGTGCRYYVALLDGMGSGIGAAHEALQAGNLLKRLLSAGFPAEHALSSLNSLCALRGRAGAVTVDLVELHLDTGKVSIFKWGAPASFVIRSGKYEKIGTAGPPPGLFVANSPEAAQRLSLRRGEILVLLSDGVGGEEALQNLSADLPLFEQAHRILSSETGEGNDDATAALIRLRPRDLTA